MGCGVCCLKCLLIFCNVIFGLIGAIFLAVGAFILASANSVIKPYLDSALDSIPGLPDAFSLKNAEAVPVGGLTLDITQLLNSVATFLVIIGVLLLLTSIFGGFGACCSNRILLYIYAAIVFVLVLIQIIIVAMFFTNALDGNIKKQMKKTIEKDYKGIDDYGLWSLAWNVVMTKYECCGVDNYQDFEVATSWNRDRQFTFGEATINLQLVTPLACCKFDGEFPSITPVNDYCAITPTPLINNMDTGCFEKIFDALRPLLTPAKGAGAALIVFQLLCGIAGLVIGIQLQKDKEVV